MNRLTVSLFVIAGLFALTAGGASAQKTEDQKKSADGTWIATGMEQNGTKLPADAVENLSIKLTIKGEDYTVTVNGTVVDKGTSKVDTSKKPNILEIKSAEGPNKGKTLLGIVEIGGETMKACYDMEGKGRPTEFATKEGSGAVLILYKREAAKKE